MEGKGSTSLPARPLGPDSNPEKYACAANSSNSIKTRSLELGLISKVWDWDSFRRGIKSLGLSVGLGFIPDHEHFRFLLSCMQDWNRNLILHARLAKYTSGCRNPPVKRYSDFLPELFRS
jgi:hypothetical protein